MAQAVQVQDDDSNLEFRGQATGCESDERFEDSRQAKKVGNRTAAELPKRPRPKLWSRAKPAPKHKFGVEAEVEWKDADGDVVRFHLEDDSLIYSVNGKTGGY